MKFDNAMIRMKWDDVENAREPRHFTDDFSCDRGYFNAEYNNKTWFIENDTLRTSAGGDVNVTYLHVFETNASVKARVRITRAEGDSKLAFLLRYNSEEAFVRGIYNGRDGTWNVDFREGADFFTYRTRFARYPMELNEFYDVEFRLDGKNAVLYCDGEQLMTTDFVDHLSPGRIGFAAQNMDVEIDSIDVTLLSGQGTVMRNVIHNILPENKYREGGTVLEMKDGSLSYLLCYDNCGFRSSDSGASWEQCDIIIPTVDRAQILRLHDGKLIKIDRERCKSAEYEPIFAYISEDDGKSWEKRGEVCRTPFDKVSNAMALNMNDKVTQLSDGRIFYCQNYESFGAKVNGFRVFCLFFYSDDEGRTWQKSETDTWDIAGTEGTDHLAECKVLECADGSLRIYSSHNPFGHIVYCESHDRGVTWGPIVHMEDYACACSSVQFCRDPYADNDTTYYMVWISSPPLFLGKNVRSGMPRSRLSLARTVDGKNWSHLGDVWRWDCPYGNGGMTVHLVDTFITVTKDYILCGSGISEREPSESVVGHSYHKAQRQHIYSIRKDTLEESSINGVLGVKVDYKGTARQS